MRNDLAKTIREAYERRPYPAVTRDAIRRSPWRLPSFAWISAVAQPSPNPPRRILVAGCGTGSEAFAMRRRFPRAEIVAVDFAERSIRIAQRLQKRSAATRDIRFLQADLTSADVLRETRRRLRLHLVSRRSLLHPDARTGAAESAALSGGGRCPVYWRERSCALQREVARGATEARL